MHSFDLLAHTLLEFIEFCKRIEFAEGGVYNNNNNNNNKGQQGKPVSMTRHQGAISRAKTTKSGTNYHKRRSNCGTKQNAKQDYCWLHQCYGHSTNQCKVVGNQIDCMQATFKMRSRSGYNSNNCQHEASCNDWFVFMYKEACKIGEVMD